MRGDTTASPRATVRMAEASSAGGTSFNKKPLAPARSALEGVLVEVEGREDQDAGPVTRRRLRDGPRRLDPVEHRHAHVHQHHVGPVELDEADGVGAVGRLADDLDAVLRLEDHPETLAQQGLVVRQHDTDGHRAMGALQSRSVARTSQPPSALGPASSRPPKAAARSAMPATP